MLLGGLLHSEFLHSIEFSRKLQYLLFSKNANSLKSRRSATGLAGCAPGFVPNPGHPALIPDVSAAWPLRAPLARAVVVCWGGGLAVPFQPTTPFSPSRAARALHAGVLAAVSGCASDP
jgi:hypothetical protein